MKHRPSRPASTLLSASLVTLALLPGEARATPGERVDGQRLLGVCQTLLGEDSSFCDVVTDWSVDKTVDLPLAEQPMRQGVGYTIRLIEGQSRYVLGMTSIVTLNGLIPAGTQVRGIVVSLQRATPVAAPAEPLYTTVAGALIGDADPTCGCPFVAAGGDLTVTMRDELGNPIPPTGGVLIDSLAYGERVVVQLDAIYDLSAAVILPGELVRIQACVQYAPGDEVDFPGCFDLGGSVRSTRACSSFDFEAYAKPDNGKVVLEEQMAIPSHPWILVNGMKARSGSPLIAPTATLLPVVPGADPLVFQVTASGQPNTESVVAIKGDFSCADIVDCGGASVCSGTVTNTATLDFQDQRGRVSASAVTTVTCLAHRCTPAEIASCDDGDPCTIDSCEVGVGCVNTPHDGACDDGDACTSGELCVAGECVAAETLACEDDGNPCTEERCDGELGCVRTNLPDRSDCDDGDPCTIDDLCIAGVCTSGAPITCDDHNPCTADTCSGNGECVNAPLDGGAGSCEDGSACTVGDHCDAGVCVAGVGPSCVDDGNPCTIETCEPGQGCVTILAPDLTSCEDGNACSSGDVCMAGKCRAGQPVDCNDQNVCTNDGCDPQLGCFNAPRAGACDDGSACTSASACLDGQCVGTSTRNCDDGNPCTVDSCDALRGCTHEPIADGSGCDDGDPCTANEICLAGTCLSSTLTQCDDDNPCTTSTCLPAQGCVHVPTSGSCEDGNLCTGPDLCHQGACVSGGAIVCDDDNPCTNDSCTPAQGCRHQPVSTGTCDDGDLCTGAGTCSGGVCRKGQAIDCDDDNPCTTGLCDALQGCVQIPVSGSCDDGNPCTGEGTCQFGLCVAGPDLVCDDGNACTADYCKPGVGCATLPRSDVPCEDGDPCTSHDTCRAGQCVSGAALVCDDGNPCTADSCGEDGCSYKPVSGGCDDGDPCTVGDACDAGQCRAGSPKDCGDGDSCTADRCEATTGACLNTRLEVGAVCEDGDLCTGCPWPEALVERGFHALDAKPDATLLPGAVSAALELDQFVGPGSGKAIMVATDDLRLIVVGNGLAYVRGTLSLPGAGARVEAETWRIEIPLTFRGVGRAGQGATPFFELPAGYQGTIYTDHWEYWTIGGGARLERLSPTQDSAELMADPGLSSLPLQVGLRANGRNLGFGAAAALKYVRGTRQGTAILRFNLERAPCTSADTCDASGVCGGGSVLPECRELQLGAYCTYTDQDYAQACTSADPSSGACRLLQGFPRIAVEHTACGASIKGVAVGHTGYRRWSFSSAQKVSAFLPSNAAVSFTLDQCNPGPASARPEVGRVLALALSIALSDSGGLPGAETGVPLGELVRLSGPCAGLTVREIARRAEVWVAGGPQDSGACAGSEVLDAEVTAIIDGFRGCAAVMGGVSLP